MLHFLDMKALRNQRKGVESVIVFLLLQVRCAAVFALGTFVGNSTERTDHSTTIDHNVAMMLAQLINDGSPVVRKVTPEQQHSPTRIKYTEFIIPLYACCSETNKHKPR